MKRTYIYSILLTCTCIPSTVFAYGEGENLEYGARALHLIENDFRMDPKNIMKDCPKEKCIDKDCYPNVSPGPLYLNQETQNASEVQAKLLAEKNHTGLTEHKTPCVLLESIGKDYPNKCDGSSSCACKAGTFPSGTTKEADRSNYFVIDWKNKLVQKPSNESYAGRNNRVKTYKPYDLSLPYQYMIQLTHESGGEKGSCALDSNSDNAHRLSVFDFSGTNFSNLGADIRFNINNKNVS